ncbi:MAG: AAA family ATPase [Anaerolineales bacterium]|nr:AAA family ATPase [Anaerolineales bacterium]
MPSFRLLKHQQYDNSAERLPSSIQRKATWSQVLLGTRGRTPSVKTTTGYNARWRRTPVQGFHYYLWWIPLSETNLVSATESAEPGRTILVHSIRHHDETDEPIILHSLDEFEEVPITSLDPRFDEQRAVGDRLTHDQLSLATIKGLPGSGKTISLFYLVRDLAGYLGHQRILYVTYTSRLKRAAREFLAVQGDLLDQQIRVRTFNELVGEVLNEPAPYVDPFGDLADFARYLDLQNPSSLGAWRKFPATLYTELRGYLFGRTFPESFHLPDKAAERLLFNDINLTAARYAATRELSAQDADLAFKLADRLRSTPFFTDQRAVTRALPAVNSGRLPPWLREIDALIIDEVQDMTMLQIALIGELARVRLRRRPDLPLAVALAGDESQVVQPSGFEWGAAKDLMRAMLGVNPAEFEYRHQRRAPRNLARLIDNAWNFYSYLPKTLRPSANRQTFIDDAGVELAHSKPPPGSEDDNGRLLICPLPEEMRDGSEAGRVRWAELAGELASLPGRALIDLTEDLLPVLATAGDDKGDEAIFVVREIKGLERGTVLLYGLNAVYEAAVRLAEGAGDNLPRLEARRLFDEMRVALSRATDKLIILESPDAPVLTELQVDQLEGRFVIGWDSLLDMLRTEEMSEIEVVEGYLDEVDDLVERGRWEQARRRNRRAYDFAMQLSDSALAVDAQEQYIRTFLAEAEDFVQRDQLHEAYVLNRQGFDLAEAHGDPEVIADVDEQLQSIRNAVERKVDAVVGMARTAAGRNDLALAYSIAQGATDLLSIMHDPALQAKLDEAMVEYGWQWGIQLLEQGKDAADRLPELFKGLADAMLRQSDRDGSQVAQIIAERYRSVPLHAELAPAHISKLIRYIDHYLEVVAPLNLEAAAFVFVEEWLEEAFDQLDGHTELYYDWALMGQTYAALTDYPPLDERLWDLENRVELSAGPAWKATTTDEHLLKFAAFSAAYNDSPALARQVRNQTQTDRSPVLYWTHFRM